MDMQVPKAVTEVARSNRTDVRNPVSKLPGVARLRALSPQQRAALREILMDIRKDAHANAEKCWKFRKGPLAVYWRAVGVYSGHIARLLRD